MPAESQTTTDYRPYGAAAGASLPALGVLEYLFKTRPEILRKLKAAPDWTLANGDIDVASALKTLQTGDFGVSGLQSSGDKATDFLVHGSAIASGGPGAHGQVVGRNVQTPHTWSRMAENARTPDLPFLMNERGELYSPRYGKDYKRFQDIRSRQEEWAAYDDARKAGKKVPKPTGNRPSKRELSFFKDLAAGEGTPASAHSALDYGRHKETMRGRARQLQELKQLQRAEQLTPAQAKQLEKLKGAQRNAATRFRRFLRDPNLRAFFDQQPTAARDANFETIQRMADEMAGTPNPAVKARVSRLSDLSRMFEQRGTQRSQQIADMIQRATTQTPGVRPAPSRPLFNPRQFERFIPTLHHGGLAGTGDDPILHAIANATPAVRGEISNLTGIGVNDLRRRLAENAKELAADRAYVAQNPNAIYRPTWGRPDSKKIKDYGPNFVDTVFDATATDGSRMRPANMPGTAAYGAGGPRSTTWARWLGGVDDARLHDGLVEQVGKSYASTGAVGAGAKETLGINTLRRLFPILDRTQMGGRSCWGNHCGSMPAQVFERTRNYLPKIPFLDTLPGTLLADPNVEIVGVANKARALKDFARLGRMRTAAGLGAAGVMGALGYGATHLLGGKPRAMPQPKQPAYDPRLVQAVKTLFPQQTQPNFNRT